MKTASYLKILVAAVLLGFCGSLHAEPAAAPDLKDILSAGGGALGNIVEGVFTKSDLTVKDIAGEWTTKGSAVSFKSDNFLKKAGGVAAAGAVESQLDTYYKKYGLTGAVFTINDDGTFVMTIKKISLKGTITVKSKGVFTFKFTAFGTFSLGTMDAYVEKSPKSLKLMFDADKIKTIISFAATISGSKMASAADKLLKQYDGICIGFKMDQTGKAPASSAGSKPDDSSSDRSTDSTSSSALDVLRGLFGN